MVASISVTVRPSNSGVFRPGVVVAFELQSEPGEINLLDIILIHPSGISYLLQSGLRMPRPQGDLTFATIPSSAAPAENYTMLFRDSSRLDKQFSLNGISLVPPASPAPSGSSFSFSTVTTTVFLATTTVFALDPSTITAPGFTRTTTSSTTNSSTPTPSTPTAVGAVIQTEDIETISTTTALGPVVSGEAYPSASGGYTDKNTRTIIIASVVVGALLASAAISLFLCIRRRARRMRARPVLSMKGDVEDGEQWNLGPSSRGSGKTTSAFTTKKKLALTPPKREKSSLASPTASTPITGTSMTSSTNISSTSLSDATTPSAAPSTSSYAPPPTKAPPGLGLTPLPPPSVSSITLTSIPMALPPLPPLTSIPESSTQAADPEVDEVIRARITELQQQIYLLEQQRSNPPRGESVLGPPPEYTGSVHDGREGHIGTNATGRARESVSAKTRCFCHPDGGHDDDVGPGQS